MEMKRASFLFIFILSVSFISAVTTQINIETFSNHDIMVSALKPGYVYNLIESFHGKSNIDGRFTANLNTNDTNKIDIKVWVKKDNQAIVIKRFDGYATGAPVTLEVYPDNYTKPVPVVNTSLNESTNKTSPDSNTTAEPQLNESADEAEGQESGARLTGSAVEGSVLSGNKIYYIGGVILLVIIIIAIFLFLKKRTPTIKEVKVRKLSEVKSANPEDYKKVAEKAERKAEELQKEVNKLKNQDKIKQIEDRIRQQQDEVRRLRRGY